MKKLFPFIVSAVLLFTGCAKEKFSSNLADGVLTDVTFTAAMQNMTGTRAVADGDGAAANVNRCIMEIYYGGELFTRMYAPVNDQKQASFTTQLAANRTYKVAFWADSVLDATTELGLIADLYYTTNADQPNGGLQAIALKGDYIGNNDGRDAFFSVKDYTVVQAGSTFVDTLRRPFAQLNVITTDWNLANKNAGLAPEKVNVKIKNPLVCFNALTGEASADPNVTELTYETAVYTSPAPVQPVSETEKTLSMDYIFGATEKSVIDIDWKALHGNDAAVTHTFASVPYQRNYRTNIKGALLTTQGQWNVTVDPIWEGQHTQLIEVADIQSANVAIAANIGSNIIDVKFKAEPNDSGVPTGEESSPSRAILTSPIAAGATLSVEVQTNTETLYVGDYATEYNVNVMASSTNAAVVNINVPQDTKIGKLVVNAPSKSVYLNGKAVANVGIFDEVDAITSQNTLVIEPDQKVKKLTVRQGGLEIHGTVDTLFITESAHDTNPVKVRKCENLSQEVFDVIYVAGDHDYIDRPAFVEKANGTTPQTWDIVPAVCKIGDNYYSCLSDAVTAVQGGETITMLRNANGDGVIVPGGKNFTIDFAGYTYFVDGNLAGSEGTKSQCFQLLSGSTLLFKNGTVSTNIASTGINNYANLTLQDMTIDMRETSKTGQVSCLQVMNGSADIKGASNLYAKENPGSSDAFIAVLSLYWPTSYGDIDIEMNTTGVVKGMLAYASYQCQDLTTVKDHAHFAVKNGKYDVTYDMDGITNPDFKLSGGLYKQKPETEYCAESYIVVESGDVAYPWKVQIDPLQAEVSIAKTGEATVYTMLAQFRDDVNAGNSYEGYTVTLLKDVTYSPSTYWKPIGYMNGTPFSGTFNGNNHKVEGLNIDTEALGVSPDYWPGGFFGCTYNASISNLTLYGQTDCAGFVGLAENTDITDCVSYMNSDLCYSISGGFIAHADAYVTLTNCKNYGNFICKTSANYCEVGGLVGRFYGGDHCSVTNCENHGNISWMGENGGGNQRSLGGIVAGFYNSNAISNPQKCVISGCKNYGVIYNKNATSGTTTTTLGGIGGIVGKPFLQSNGIGVTITNCVNEGTVISSGRAGGIIGTLNEAWQNVGKFSTVSDYTNSGTIYGTDGSRGQIYGVMSTNESDPAKDTVLSNNTENGTLKAYGDYIE